MRRCAHELMTSPCVHVRAVTALGVLALALLSSAPSAAITYVHSGFEGGPGDFAGGVGFSQSFLLASNVVSSNLNGRALDFQVDAQMRWLRGQVADSPLHRISFDYYSNPGATVTGFLDAPLILRFDLRAVGRHHVDFEFDLAAQTANAYLDGTLDNGLISILAWSSPYDTSGIRIANQTGNSFDRFQIDNLDWQGSSIVPEPGSGLLMGLGIALLAWRRHEPLARTRR